MQVKVETANNLFKKFVLRDDRARTTKGVNNGVSNKKKLWRAMIDHVLNGHDIE